MAELNELELCQGDVGNAYLMAKTKEKVYIIAGAGFGELEDHTLIIHKALYGLFSSGKRYHEFFADTMHDMGFFPSKADPDVWMRKNGDFYDYVAVYVDDLVVAAKKAQTVLDTLQHLQAQVQDCCLTQDDHSFQVVKSMVLASL